MQGLTITKYKLPFYGHKLIRGIVKSNALDLLLSTLVNGSDLGPDFFTRLRARHDNRQWNREFVAELMRQKKYKHASIVSQRLLEKHDYRFARQTLKQIEKLAV